MYYALHRGQPDASTFECIRMVQTLKYAKQLIHVLHIKAYSIVFNEYYQVIFIAVGASYLDFGLRACARKFDRIRKKINQHKP
jgi:hypothetical protein